MPYMQDIVSKLQEHKHFSSFTMFSYPIENIKQFVFDIYAFNPPQRSQLRKKIKTLKKAPNYDVLVIFAINNNPDYQHVGLSEKPYLQCQTVYNFKEKIRSLHNAKESNGDYRDVLHSSDSEQEADHIARAIGLKDGLDYLKSDVGFSTDNDNTTSVIKLESNTRKDAWLNNTVDPLRYYIKKIIKHALQIIKR